MFNKSTMRFSFSAASAPADSVVNTIAILKIWRMPWTRTIVTGFILFLGLQFAARASDVSAYMITTNEDFGTIDLNTGAFTSVGAESIALAGLGEIGSTLYTADYAAGTGTLYTVNTSSGALTQQGSTDNTVEYLAFGSTLTGLYALENIAGSFDLYSVNSTTGLATLVGATGVAQGGDFTLSTNSSTLYLAEGADLYTLSLTTGAASLVGATGATGAGFGGLVTESGTLYGGQYQDPTAVDTLNTSTGAATFVSDLSGATGSFAGLAPIPVTTATPEPGNVSLLLLGLLAGGAWVQTRLSNNRRSKRQPE
jgi:hypothetical protein